MRLQSSQKREICQDANIGFNALNAIVAALAYITFAERATALSLTNSQSQAKIAAIQLSSARSFGEQANASFVIQVRRDRAPPEPTLRGIVRRSQPPARRLSKKWCGIYSVGKHGCSWVAEGCVGGCGYTLVSLCRWQTFDTRYRLLSAKRATTRHQRPSPSDFGGIMNRVGQLKRLTLFLSLTIVSAAVLLTLRASPAGAQVQNLCLQELDGIVSPDSYADISTEEACSSDQSGGPTGNNNSWGDLISAGPPTVPNPASGTGAGGAFSGVLQTVPDQMTVGTKVTDPINGTSSHWVYGVKSGGPAKSDLQQGATGSYTYTQSPAAFPSGPATGDEILNYLVTRSTNNGSELQGVWLFLGPVSLTDPSCTSKCTFTGHHTNNDLYLLSAFTKGGGQVGIQAYQWKCSGTGQACDDSGSLVNVANGACSGAGFGTGSNFLCGEVNDHSITVPSQLPNPSTGTSLATGLFYNGAVDITNLFVTTPCFSSVMFESISSPSCSTVPCSSIGNADAKFFIFGNFNTCAINVNKTCGQGIFNADQSAATYPVAGLVSNADGGTLSVSSITDSPAFDSNSLGCFSSAQSFNGTSCTASKDACLACERAVLAGTAGAPSPDLNCSSASLTASGTAGGAICYGGSITNPVSACVGASCTDTVTASATGPGGSTIKPKMATATCTIEQLAAGLNVTKNCQAGLVSTGSVLEVQVNTGYLVCNEQPAILSNVTLSDNEVSSANITTVSGGITCPAGATPPCLAPEGKTGDCATFTGFYIPTSLGQISGVGPVPACVNGSLTNGTQDFLADTATATGQCNTSVCSAPMGSSCTVVGSTVKCTAMGGASCPLCPLQTLSPASPPTAENPD
jgi:hypothetical protein